MKKRNIYTMAELQLVLQSAFNAANRDLFGGELQKVVITAKEGQRKHAYGWITLQKGWIQGKVERYEINISSEYLTRPVVDVMCTLVHEMCHLWNIQHGIQDCSRAGVYHNKAFRDCAEKHLLLVEHCAHIGYGRTSPSSAFAAWVHDNIGVSSFRIYQKGEEDSGEKKKKPSSTRKLVCPECGATVRATKEVNVICGDCWNPDEYGDPVYFVSA